MLLEETFDKYLKKSGDHYIDFSEGIVVRVADGWFQYSVKPHSLFIHKMLATDIANGKIMLKSLKLLAKAHGVNCIQFTTARNPKAWERAYNAKKVGYVMQIELGGEA